MYFLLSTSYPFTGSNLRNLMRNIVAGAYTFHSKRVDWDTISSEAKDLISKMLITRPLRRISINNALKHDWFKKMEATQEIALPHRVVRNLANFKLNGKVQKEILKVLVRELNESEISRLRDLFFYLDRD